MDWKGFSRKEPQAKASVAAANAELAGVLCRRDREELVAYLRRALGGNAALAEDMAQEALTRIVLSKRRYEGQRARGLLFTIARNLLVDHYRHENARARALHSLGVLGNDAENRNPLRDLVAREDMDLARETIRALPPRCQQVFILNRFEHMSYAAIARHCQISVSMVEKHIHRALMELVSALEETGQDRTGHV